MLRRGRILRGNASVPRTTNVPHDSQERVGQDDFPKARRMHALEAAARTEATRILAEARHEAEMIRKNAEARAQTHAAEMVREARHREAAQWSAAYLTLRSREALADERQLDRNIDLARLLAERLLGKALTMDPSLVGALAKQALSEARGAQAVRLDAHPDDCVLLTSQVDELANTMGLVRGSVSIQASSEMDRGELRVHTDLGTLHARIDTQLQYLADALREALRPR